MSPKKKTVLKGKTKQVDYQDYLPFKTRIIKEKLRISIENTGIKHAYLAAQLGCSATRLTQYITESEEGRFHLDNLPIFLRETKDFSILEDIAAMFGYRLVPESALEALDNPAVRELVESLSQVVAAARSGKK
jgi:hypothetical protein